MKFLYVIAIGFVSIFACKPSPESVLKSSKNLDHVNSLVVANQESVLKNFYQNSRFSNFKNLIVFGDSLSGWGRLNQNTFGFMVKPDTYWKSRWSNGPNWVDYIANTYDLRVANYAVGGAATQKRDLFFENLVIPTLFDQVQMYLKSTSRFDHSNSLFVIWIGPNNYFQNNISNVEQTVKDITNAAKHLINNGVKHLVIGNMMRLGDSPSALAGKFKPAEKLKELSRQHNFLLNEAISNLKSSNSDITLYQFDAYRRSIETQLYFETYGFSNITDACYTGDLRGNYKGEKFCKEPKTYKYWDDIHPSSLMHCYYAAEFIASVTYQPFSIEKAKRACLKGL
jgi:phospholipase/lecithinase/hemolysin